MPENVKSAETWYPLRLMVCNECWLVQTEDYADCDELFTDEYAYFSSTSKSWLAHAEDYVEKMVARFDLSQDSTVVEIAANDGYLLQYVNKHGVPCYGIEPTSSTAEAAREKGVEIIEEFFGVSLAQSLVRQGRLADLIAANNVLAHVPDINDFVAGFACLLKPEGVATFEFPHLLKMVQQTQFDTAYHEHYSYLSLTTVSRIFESNGLKVFDVEELPTHGGSLRVFAQRQDCIRKPLPSVNTILDEESSAGMNSSGFYSGFQIAAERLKNDLLEFLLRVKKEGKTVAAYGAAAKGNTLLNFAGVKPDLLPFVCDAAKAKQEKFLPGSHIPILSPEALEKNRPDYILVLPWNIVSEVKQQLSCLHKQGSSFVTAVPKLVVH
jgi:2-polyprenyl-3-methyl-5-hydroxy-6-metoxy-1,4-benzoquinol methylase